MYAITDIPTEAERVQALAGVPHQAALRKMAGHAFGILRDQTVDFIDVAAEGLGRATLVAFQEGVDSLLQATIELVEASLVEQVLDRSSARDPLGVGELLPETESEDRVRRRLVRCAVEDAAVRTVTGVDHLVNTHLRLAWELNAADEADLKRCGLKLAKSDSSWASVHDLASGLEKLDESESSGSLRRFRCNPAFRAWVADPDVEVVREFRRQVIHRARPSFQDAMAFGRASVYQPDGSFFLNINPYELPQDESLPTLTERHAQVSRAIAAAVPYVQELWETMMLWLPMVGVQVDYDSNPGIMRVQIGILDPTVVPRAHRDPEPFLSQDAQEAPQPSPAE